MARRYAFVGAVEEALLNAFAPGPLTVICPVRAGTLSSRVTGGGMTVAVRIPQSEIALELIRRVDCGLAAPSANRSGRPSPTDAEHACAEMEGRVAAVLDGGTCRVGIESTVACWNGEEVLVLRPGAITGQALNAVADAVVPERRRNMRRDDGFPAETRHESHRTVRSPGTRYRHYAPAVPVFLFDNLCEVPRSGTGDIKSGTACICTEATAKNLCGIPGPLRQSGSSTASAGEDSTGFGPHSERRSNGTLITFASFELLSANLYRWLWKLEGSVSAIWIELPPDLPEFQGLRDRLLRAAERNG